MLVLIHGDDTIASRKKLTDLLEQTKDYHVVRLDGKRLDKETLVTVGESASLFAEKKILVIESLLNDLRTKAKTELVSYIASGVLPHSVIFWEGKTLEKAMVRKYLPTAKEYAFPLPARLFQFIESIGRVPAASAVAQFRTVIEHDDAGLVYAMLLRQWRYLILAKDMGGEGFPPQLRWQSHKYVQQAQHFTMDQLIRTYRQLLAIDYKIKTGDTAVPLETLIDIFLLDL